MTALPSPPVNPGTRGQSRVIDAVRGLVDRGELRVGDPLPTMRSVADSLSVDKGTVCRAMALLQSDGVVRREGRRLHLAAPFASGRRGPAVLSDTLLVVTAAEYGRAGGPSGWLPSVIEGLLSAAHERRRHALLIHPRSTRGPELDRLVAGRPLGCVAVATGDDEHENRAMLDRLRGAGLPVVIFGEEINSRGHDIVTGDHREGCRRLVHWMAERDRRRVLRYWPYRIRRVERPLWLDHRDEGYAQATRELGLDALPALEYARPDLGPMPGPEQFATRVRHAAGFLAEHVLGPDPVDAVLTPSDDLGYEVAEACTLLGLRPNRDVLVAGYNADWASVPQAEWATHRPAVTVEHDEVALGQRLVESLLERIESPRQPPRVVTVPPRLIPIEDVSSGYRRGGTTP